MDDNKICVATEASDLSYQFNRTSIYSFINANPWFDGTIYLLTNNEAPLSFETYKQLTCLYPKIKVVDTSSDESFNNIISSIKLKNANYKEIILNYLKFYAFNLEAEGILYFSRYSLFLNSIAELVKPESFSISTFSNSFPSIDRESSSLNSSIFYVSKNNLSSSHYSSLIELSHKYAIFSPKSDFEVINLYFHNFENVSVYPNTVVADYSNFVDRKYLQLSKYLNTVKAISYGNLNDGTTFLKIRNIWFQYNKQATLYLSKPSVNNNSISSISYEVPDLNTKITSTSLKFLIVCSGLNCGNNVKKCFTSIVNQTYKNFKAILISDGSTDNTADELLKIKNIDPRVSVEIYEDNKAAAYRRYFAINNSGIDEETVIVLVGLDDHIFPDALATIKQQYDAGKWMTYGNWINQYGKMLPKGFLHFDEETHKNRDYRKVLYRSTGLNTFKKFLFDNIPVDDFKMDGKWIDSTTESELMFSCLEMCGKDKIGIIEKAICLYNANLPGGTLRRLGSDYKYKIYDRIVLRPKKDLLIRP